MIQVIEPCLSLFFFNLLTSRTEAGEVGTEESWEREATDEEQEAKEETSSTGQSKKKPTVKLHEMS